MGIDVHDPPTDEPFDPLGKVQGLPQREVSLHWDGRELVKRLAPREFRGDWVDLRIDIVWVCGGAEVSVALGAGRDALPALALGSASAALRTMAYRLEWPVRLT